MTSHNRPIPKGLFDSRGMGYHQVQVSTGTRIVHFAGQAALDADAQVIGADDFAVQLGACLANIDLACTAAEVERCDIASLRIYVVDLSPELAPLMVGALREFFGADSTPPGTLIGVACLAMPELLIEIEATAIA